MKTLVIGGARSGKSLYAEQLALNASRKLVYIATAQALDSEMTSRIALHQERRSEHWQLVESPMALVETLKTVSAPDTCVLVDCLTLWLTNHLLANESLPKEMANARLADEVQQLANIVPSLPGDTIFVTNEVGWGIVPMGELSRRFQDEAGRMNQYVAAACDQVVLTVAGVPMPIKSK